MGPQPPRKRLKTRDTRPETIPFDPAARSDYLTGFHKRKQAKLKAGRERAILREKEQRITDRKELRDQRKADLEAHVETVNTLIREANGIIEGASDSDNSTEWTGFTEEPPEPEVIDHEAQYVDEDRFTTVTVEAVEIARDGIHTAADAAVQDGVEGEGSVNGVGEGEGVAVTNVDTDGKKVKVAPRVDSKGKRIWTKDKPIKDRPKKRKKSFRYESKAERKVTRYKERSKGKEQAKMRKGA